MGTVLEETAHKFLIDPAYQKVFMNIPTYDYSQ